MAFSFIHSADLQIGRTYSSLPAEVGHALKEARLAAIDRLAEAAQGSQALHILVAGDVFDGEFLAPATLRQPLARMRAHPKLTWHLLPGNHDPHRPAGLWERLVADGLPANVRPWLVAEPGEIAPGVWLLPAPLTAKATSRDPTGYMDGATTPAGAVRIGLAHGSIKGFGGDGDAAVPIAPDRARRAGLTYLALGDWHGCVRISERAWYPGTPEPDRYTDNDAGMALRVCIGGPQKLPEVERLPTGYFTWQQTSLHVTGGTEIEQFEAALRLAKIPLDRRLVKLALTGSVSLSERANVLAAAERLAPALRHLELDTTGLASTAQTHDFDRLRRHGALAAVANQLHDLSQGAGFAGAAPNALVAARALEQLFALAASLEAET